jgi:hypothetical protein
MAQLVRTDSSIVFKLGPLEHLIAFHFRPIEVPIINMASVEIVEDVWTRVRGVRAPLTWSKDHFMVGARRGLFGKDFTAIYGLGRGVCVDFAGGSWTRFVIRDDFPEDLAALMRG